MWYNIPSLSQYCGESITLNILSRRLFYRYLLVEWENCNYILNIHIYQSNLGHSVTETHETYLSIGSPYLFMHIITSINRISVKMNDDMYKYPHHNASRLPRLLTLYNNVLGVVYHTGHSLKYWLTRSLKTKIRPQKRLQISLYI